MGKGCAEYSPDPDWFRPGLRGKIPRDSHRKTPVLLGCTRKVAQKMRAQRPHLLSYFSSPSEQNSILARTIPRQKASQTRPDPVRIRAVFGTASLHQFFLDYLATRWLWKLTLWSFSSAIFDIPEIDLRLCISGSKIDLSQIFWGFLRMKIRK